MELDETARDILTEIGNIGAGNAVTSLSMIMGHPVELDIPALRIVKYQEVYGIIEGPQWLQAGILVEVTGELEGVFLFMLSESFTETILNMVLGEKERILTDLDEMDRSFICELGNIMCGSYIRALSQLMDMEMDVSVPEMCVDMGGAILSYPLSRWVIVSDDILLIENTFHLSDKAFKGLILFLPEQEDLGTILSKLME